MKNKFKVAMLRGGASDEHHISLRSGEHFKKRIDEFHNVTDIVVDRSGEWFVDGILYNKKNIARDFDLVVNTMKGGDGENGRLSKYLDTFGVKHNNAGAFGSALTHNKHEFKNFLKRHEIKTPLSMLIDGELDVETQKKELHHRMFLPAIVKPIANGSSIGVFVAQNFEEVQKYIDWILKRDRFALVEEYIEGLDVSVMTTANFRGQEVYSFLPVGIDTPDIISYDHKFNNTHQFFSTENLSRNDRDVIQDIAKKIHSTLDLETLAITDFRVHPKRGVFALETNTVPNYEDNSIYDESLKVLGVSEEELVDHIINLSLSKKRR